MKIEVELIFKNKKVKDNLIIDFDENIRNWIIKTENQEELNKILTKKIFLTGKDIINFLNKHKYKFDRNKIQQLKKPYLKSFVFNFKENYGWSGGDDLNNINIITLKFKGKNAYFYTSEHDGMYSGFDSFWKMQHEGSSAQIWQKIFELDKNGYICFNDLYDKYENEYSNLSEDFYNNEENEENEYQYDDIVEYAKEKLTEDEALIIEFCDKYISLLDNYEDEMRNENSLFVLKCITNFYLEYPSFYHKEINISNENWDILEEEIGKTESSTKYRHDLLMKKLPPKDKKDKKNKI